MVEVLVFIITFAAMEWAAWFLHRYVMHGFLWNLHEDHHKPKPNYRFQKNDWFAVVFAVPSFLLILFGSMQSTGVMSAVGYSIMAYGAAYFFVHEVIIHRRFWDSKTAKSIWMKFVPQWYVEGVQTAHRIHHQVREKYDSENFGMLVVDQKYFREAAARLKKKSVGAPQSI